MRMIKAALALALIAIVPDKALADDHTSGSKVDLERASFTSNHPLWPGQNYTLLDNGRAFHSPQKGDFASYRTWISPSVFFGSNSGGHSLAYEVLPVPFEQSKTQKIMHEIFNKPVGKASEDWFAFGQKRYIGFAFRVSPKEAYSQVPLPGPDGVGSSRTLVFQLWQGSPFRPPVAAHLRGDGATGLELSFVVRNWTTGTCPSTDAPIPVTAVSLKRGHWYKIVVMAIPRNEDHIGNGELRIWVADSGYFEAGSANAMAWDAAPLQVARWFGKIGYGSGTTYCHTETKANPGMFASVGLYRNKQPTRMRVFFDQIRVTNTFAAAEPFSWPPILN